MTHLFEGKKILVTGGTGSIGSVIVRKLLAYNPAVIRVLSRDDTKQFIQQTRLSADAPVRFLLGDVRDKARLARAMEDIDIVFHTAALKHVHSTEYDPFEAVQTNVVGTQNVIDCALEAGVGTVVGISTDKAADPTNVLGCTKLLAEKLLQAASNYRGGKATKFCIVRFGNVIGTRGSVVPLFCHQVRQGGPITLTDPNMTRFFMTIEHAVDLIFKATALTRNREIFILKMPLLRIQDLAEAVRHWFAPKCGRNPEEIQIKTVGRRPGERLHETLVGRSECLNALETPEMFILAPDTTGWHKEASTADYPNARRAAEKEYSTASPELQKYLLSQNEIMRLLDAAGRDIREALF